MRYHAFLQISFESDQKPHNEEKTNILLCEFFNVGSFTNYVTAPLDLRDISTLQNEYYQSYLNNVVNQGEGVKKVQISVNVVCEQPLGPVVNDIHETIVNLVSTGTKMWETTKMKRACSFLLLILWSDCQAFDRSAVEQQHTV